MHDADVRRALRGVLEDVHRDEMGSTRFVDELGICGQVRVDVAVLNGALSGYELKSATDSLRRFPVQVEYYSKVLDFATLVVAENHLERARQYLPGWWGCTVAHWVNDRVILEELTPPSLNSSWEEEALAILLWRDEALDELDSRGLASGRRSWTRQRICNALASELSITELRDVVRERLKARTGWRSG